MREVPGYKLLDWPFKDYKYISDLIDFDGPVLVHYMTDDASHHALYYWVESNEKYNRWLCFGVTGKELYNYIHNSISLFELIERKKQESFYTVDIDKDLIYSNFHLIKGYAIPDEYYPDVNSYYLDEITPYYNDLFEVLIKKESRHS